MKEVFVLGAGASNALADTPLGHELVWTYHQDCCSFSPIIGGRPDNSEEDIEFSDYKKFLELAGSIWPEFEGEVEKFINRGKYVYTPPYILNKDNYVDELLRILHDKGNSQGVELVRRLIFKHIVGAGFTKSDTAYNDFRIKVLRPKKLEEVSIICINFDFLLHEDFKKDIYFDYSIDFDCIDGNRARMYKRQNPIPMIKLNGSLEWAICQKCNRRYLYFPHMQRNFYEHARCIISCNGNIYPFIIIPHQKGEDIIKILYDKAKQKLSQAEKITVIGYSFPEYDKKIMALFRDALSSNIAIEVVDFCPPHEDSVETLNKIKEKYKSMFPQVNKEIRIYLDGFSKWLSVK